MLVNKTDDFDEPMTKKQMDRKILATFWYNCKTEIGEQLTLLQPKSLEEAVKHTLITEETKGKKRKWRSEKEIDDEVQRKKNENGKQ